MITNAQLVRIRDVLLAVELELANVLLAKPATLSDQMSVLLALVEQAQLLAQPHALHALLLFLTAQLALLTLQNVLPVPLHTISPLQQVAYHVPPPIVSLALLPVAEPHVPLVPLDIPWQLVPAQPPARLENTQLMAPIHAQLVMILDARLVLPLELLSALHALPITSS